MNEDSTGAGGAAGILAILLVLVLLLGGGAFYLVTERRQQALEAVTVRAQVAEGRSALAHAEALEEAQRATLAELRMQQQRAARQTAEGGPATTDVATMRVAIEAVLRTQQEAWNRGDVDAFMEHYWKSEDLTFSSGGKTTRGWEDTLRGYRERYPTREAMGQLTFANLEVTPLADAAALVLGQWRLERDESVSGNFSLIFRKLDGRWLILHDHTSRLAD